MRMRTKLKALALAGCATLAAMALALAGCGGGASGGNGGSTSGTPVSMEESYRVISVIEHNGGSTVTRGDGGEQIALYDGLSLQSGDDVVTGANANLTMLIDSDKYLYAEDNTHFWLEASGKEGSSHTTIHLEDGCVLFRLDTKLNAGESYQLSTPSATMSIRGTCGVLEQMNSTRSKLYLLEGQVTLGTGSNATTVYGGQTATIVPKPNLGSGEQSNGGDPEPKVTVEKMTIMPNATASAGEGVFPSSLLRKILEFSVDSGKTMNFGDMEVTSGQAENLLSKVDAGSTTVSKAISSLPKTSGSGQRQDNSVAGGTAAGEDTQQPAHTHSYTSKVTTKASCAQSGVRTFTCSCGDSYTETISALGHKSVTVPGKDATCTESGLTAGAKCSVCSETLVKQKEVAALGHDLVADDAQPATCIAAGKAAGQHCSRCDYTTGGEEIAALGHNYVSSGTPATCTEAGYSSSTCTRCGDTTGTTIIPALGHFYDEGGTCTRCGKTESECDHDYSVMKIEAFCTVGPQLSYICNKCGKQYLEDLEGEPLGHSWELNADGSGYECSRCTAKYDPSESECTHTEVSLVGHKEPTCYQSGYDRYSCKVCTFTYEEKLGATGEHEYNGNGVCAYCGATMPTQGEEENSNQGTDLENQAVIKNDELGEVTLQGEDATR